MPKMKTHKGTAKRFRVTGTGKIVRAKAFKSHIRARRAPSVSAISAKRLLSLSPTSVLSLATSASAN